MTQACPTRRSAYLLLISQVQVLPLKQLSDTIQIMAHHFQLRLAYILGIKSKNTRNIIGVSSLNQLTHQTVLISTSRFIWLFIRVQNASAFTKQPIHARRLHMLFQCSTRAEERRVGQKCVSRCSSRWSRDRSKKKKKKYK